MKKTLERTLFHSVGVIDYLKKNSTTSEVKMQKYFDKIENILQITEDDRNYFLNTIKEKTEYFEKSEIAIRPTKEQLDYLMIINQKKVDKPFVIEMNKIRNLSCKLDKSSDMAWVKDILFKLSSFPFCHCVEAKHDEIETAKITEDVFYYLNLINGLFPTVKEEVNKIKELYYPLYYSYIMKNYFADDEDDDFDIVSLIMDFDKYDVDRLLGMNDRLYPSSYNDDLLNRWDSEQEMEEVSGLTIDGEHSFFGDDPGDGQGSFLQFILMDTGGLFRNKYEFFYKKFMSVDISNMYLNQAITAQFDKKKSHGKMLLKHVNEEKVTDVNKPLYKELKAAFTAPGKTKFKSKDISDKIAMLLLSDVENLLPNLLVDLDTPLGLFCIRRTIGFILDDVRFNANDIEFLLNYSPNTVRAYLLKPTKYIFKQNISELYKMSVYLLVIDMLDESRLLINKLIEMSENDENLFNEDEFKILENQLKLVELSLEYKK